MKQNYRYLLMVVSLAMAPACPDKTTKGGKEEKGAPPKLPESIVVQIDSEPPSLVALIHPDSWSHHIALGNVIEPLLRFSPRPPHRLEGLLAKRWLSSKDGMTWDLFLRRDVRWHDGKPFRARDVVFTLQRVLDEKVRAVSARATLAPFVKKIVAVDEHHVRIHCKRLSPFFLESLTTLPILPAHLMSGGDLNTHPLLRKPVGTGPYRFESWKSGVEIALKRNPGYWGTPAANGRLVFRIVRSPAVALRLAERGQVHFLPRLHGNQVEEQVRKNPRLAGYRLVEHVTPGTAFVLLNHKRKIFNDVRVRRALAMLLDVKTIVTRLMFGYARRIASLYWVDDPDHDPSIQAIPFSPQRAVKLLQDAGWRDSDGDGVRDRGGRQLRFIFLVLGSSKTTRRWATLYQQELRKAGVRMEIQTIEWAAYLRRIRQHNFDMGTLGMMLGGLYTDLYLQFHSSQMEDGQNYSAYNNPVADRLMESIRGTLDRGRRRIAAQKLQRVLAADVPVIPLFTLTEPGLVDRRLQFVRRSPLWYQLREWRFSHSAAKKR